jgi:predicted transcriptional regulator
MTKNIDQLYNPEAIFKREIGVDSFLIDSCFSNADGLNFEETRDLTFDEVNKIEDITFIINNMLPDIEKQVVYFLFFLKKNQETVGKLLNISQEMVYYYKKRALLRIKIHSFFRKVDIDKMDEFLKKNVTKKQYIAMVEYFKEHDLKKIAKKISIIENRTHLYESMKSRIKLGMKKLKLIIKSNDNENLVKDAKFYLEIFTILTYYKSLHHTQSKKQVPKEIEA